MPGRHTLFFIHGMGDTQPLPNFNALWAAIADHYDERGSHQRGDFNRRFAPGFIEWHGTTDAAKTKVFETAFAPDKPQRELPGVALHPMAAARTFMTFFLGDVAAYVSEHDNNIRRTVWNEMKRQDRGGPFSLIAHSLGSVIAFDFLFDLLERDRNLFGPLDPLPAAEAEALRERFRGLYTMGSPIGLFMLRNGTLWLPQHGVPFDNVINPLSSGKHAWLNFYDDEDVIAYPLRRLFSLNPDNSDRTIEDIAVNTGWNPISAHIAYWKCDQVAKHIADSLV